MSIKVLIVDDSALVRKVLSDIISRADDMELVDTAHDPLFAVQKLKKKEVDVIILDIEMPRMDGLTFLEKLMRVHPLPVIILSSLTGKNTEISLQALESGAFDVIAKPDDILELSSLEQRVIDAVRSAAGKGVREKLKERFLVHSQVTPASNSDKVFTSERETTDKVIVIGSSTGGTVAIQDLLSGLPTDIPGIVVVQHLPLRYSHSFAERLNSKVSLTVKVAEDGDQIRNGFVYIAPGDIHCSIKASGAKYVIKLKDGPRVHYHKPSVAVLFNSVANYAGKNAVGIMLTGMGDDGAMAMRHMKDSGSYNIVQDEESSVVWGMPGKAVEKGAASIVLPLNQMAKELRRCLHTSAS